MGAHHQHSFHSLTITTSKMQNVPPHSAMNRKIEWTLNLHSLNLAVNSTASTINHIIAIAASAGQFIRIIWSNYNIQLDCVLCVCDVMCVVRTAVNNQRWSQWPIAIAVFCWCPNQSISRVWFNFGRKLHIIFLSWAAVGAAPTVLSQNRQERTTYICGAVCWMRCCDGPFGSCWMQALTPIHPYTDDIIKQALATHQHCSAAMT